MNQIEIYQPWGGLGDNLAHSLIPELCYKHGIKCFLSKYNVTRNQEIHDLVWGNNPYLEKEKGNTTNLSWLDKCAQFEIPGQLNHIQVIQKVYGFDTSIEYPKIYYKPKLLLEYKNYTLIDLSSFSAGRAYKPQRLKYLLKQFNLDNNTLAVKIPNVTYGTKFDLTNVYKSITILTLEQYADMLFSCHRFISLHGGQACLASTIKHQTNTDLEINVITLDRYLPQNSCNYTFKNTNYIT